MGVMSTEPTSSAVADASDVEMPPLDGSPEQEAAIGKQGKTTGGYDKAMNDARAAYKKGDAAASALAHQQKLEHNDAHSHAGDYIKSIVFGGLDGIITTFSVVAGASGGNLSTAVILILGFSNLFSDGLSMGLGDTLSTMAENDHINHERSREEWEMETAPEAEIEEMIDLYVQRGMSKEDATGAITLMSKYKDFFVDVMMAEELGLSVPDPDDKPWVGGLITFASFVFFGLWPLLGYLIVPASAGQTWQFVCAILLTIFMLGILGAVKSQFSTYSWYRSAAETIFMGGLAAGSAFFIGWFVRLLISPDSHVSESGCPTGALLM